MEFGFEPASNQLRTISEPASVMEFGFYNTLGGHSWPACPCHCVVKQNLEFFWTNLGGEQKISRLSKKRIVELR